MEKTEKIKIAMAEVREKQEVGWGRDLGEFRWKEVRNQGIKTNESSGKGDA